jgi:GWxTD domain-containing protein
MGWRVCTDRPRLVTFTFMKNIVLIFSLLAGFQSMSVAQRLRAEFAFAQFDSPEDGPYLEFYLKLFGNSLVPVKTENGEFGEIVVSYKLTRMGAVAYQDVAKVTGPLSANGMVDFIDQKRIPLKLGKHELELRIKDANDPDDNEVVINQTVDVDEKLLKVYMSDIELLHSFSKTTAQNLLSKAGYDLVPLTNNFFNEDFNTISFYFEVYNTFRKFNEEEEFLVNMFIENADDGSVVNGLRKFSKKKGSKVVPVLHSFPLDQVPSGNYNLIVEARDQKNELLDRKSMFFQRSNTISTPVYVPDEPTTDETMEDISLTWVSQYNRPEDLEQYLRCLHPISNQDEIQYVNRKINFNDAEMMKRFMFNFWKKRNPDDPESAWKTYWKEVEKVNSNYSTNLLKGYDTDRGRVYLQYGPPNTISPNYFEPNTYPYEIWHYYTLQDHISAPQSNRKFIFANMDSGIGDFRLIHSDADNEITNRRWNYDLHKRNNALINLDDESVNPQYGGRSEDFYRNPY